MGLNPPSFLRVFETFDKRVDTFACHFFRSKKFFSAILLFILLSLNSTVAACDGRISSPTFPEMEILPGQNNVVLEGVPVQVDVIPPSIPPQFNVIPPEIPQLPQPLITDALRNEGLSTKLDLYYLLRRNGIMFMGDQAEKEAILPKQILVEKKIEAALVYDGFPPQSILARAPDIRSLLFYNGNGKPFSVSTLNNYLDIIERKGTRESLPYKKVLKAIKKFDILM